MRNVAISVGVIVLALVIWVATRKPLSIDDELGKLVPEDRQALEAIATAAGVTPNQLRPVGPGVLQYNPKAVAIQEGHVVELRLGDAPITRFDAISRLTGLRVLWLDGSNLSSLQGIASLKALRTLNLSRSKLGSLVGLAGHPSLERLNLSQCGLDSIAELRDLAKLEELDLSGNKLGDVAALTALPALSSLDLSGNPVKALPSPVPARWKVKSDMPASAPAPSNVKTPDNWVDSTPKTSGQSKQGTLKGMVTNASYTVEGTISSMTGAILIPNIAGVEQASGGNTTLELEVKQGRVRAYLESAIPDPGSITGQRTGYIYAEATPGKPGQIVGALRSFGGTYGKAKAYQIVIESLDGEAQGVSYKLWRK